VSTTDRRYYSARVSKSKEEFDVAKDSLRRAYTKIPCPADVVVEDDAGLVG